MSEAHQTTARKSKAKTVFPTAGEVFADGCVLDIVAARPGSTNDLGLLFWDGRKTRIAPEVEHRGKLYRPIQIHETVRRAVPLPSGAQSYGSTARLLAEAAGVFEKYLGLPTAENVFGAGWSATTWLADRTSSPPPLLISGPDMDLAVRFFLLLQCICRRALLMADVSGSTIRTLPMNLRPTLLVNEPDLPPKVRSLWRASNYRGVFVHGRGGSILDIACAKALYLALEPAADAWSESALQLAVLPSGHELPALNDSELAGITNRFQPKMQMFRLKNVGRVTNHRPASSKLNLPACIEEEPDFAKAVSPIVERQKQDALVRRARDVKAAVIEVLWDPCHQMAEIPVDKIAQLTNALLRDRGEILEYRNEEIGWCLKGFGLYRHREASGMLLRFSREHRLRVHQAARQCGLTLPLVDGCSDCDSPESYRASSAESDVGHVGIRNDSKED
jgi:hypothetical protein